MIRLLFFLLAAGFGDTRNPSNASLPIWLNPKTNSWERIIFGLSAVPKANQNIQRVITPHPFVSPFPESQCKSLVRPQRTNEGVRSAEGDYRGSRSEFEPHQTRKLADRGGGKRQGDHWPWILLLKLFDDELQCVPDVRSFWMLEQNLSFWIPKTHENHHVHAVYFISITLISNIVRFGGKLRYKDWLS